MYVVVLREITIKYSSMPAKIGDNNCLIETLGEATQRRLDLQLMFPDADYTILTVPGL